MRIQVVIVVVAATLTVLAHSTGMAQSKKERGERLLQDQEKSWGISCKSLHPKAHQFVSTHAAALAGRSSASAPLDKRFMDLANEVRELADQTLKCYGLEPIAVHSGLSFESDFGELHEVLRHSAELIDSFRSGEPEVARSFRLRELQKRMHELKTGTGRRYPARV